MTKQNQSLLHDMVKGVCEAYNDSYTKLVVMGAVYVYALRSKVYKGDKVHIEGNRITSKDNPTHEITALMGTLAGNKLQIEVRNLSNNEVSTIDL